MQTSPFRDRYKVGAFDMSMVNWHGNGLTLPANPNGRQQCRRPETLVRMRCDIATRPSGTLDHRFRSGMSAAKRQLSMKPHFEYRRLAVPMRGAEKRQRWSSIEKPKLGGDLWRRRTSDAGAQITVYRTIRSDARSVAKHRFFRLAASRLSCQTVRSLLSQRDDDELTFGVLQCAFMSFGLCDTVAGTESAMIRDIHPTTTFETFPFPGGAHARHPR